MNIIGTPIYDRGHRATCPRVLAYGLWLEYDRLAKPIVVAHIMDRRDQAMRSDCLHAALDELNPPRHVWR